jgi:hypothetical protein
LLELNDSQLSDHEKINYKNRIRDELLTEYFWFMTQTEYMNFLVPKITPLITSYSGDIIYLPFTHIYLKQDFEYFREQIRPDIPSGYY